METKRKVNIYPYSVENIEAVLLHYFPESKKSEIITLTTQMFEVTTLKMADIEYLAKLVSDNLAFFRELGYKQKMENGLMSVLFGLIYTALFKPEEEWTGSVKRLEILRECESKFSNYG